MFVTALRVIPGLVVPALLAAFPVRAQRVLPPPRLQPGQTLVYQIETGGSRSTKVLSRVTAPESPAPEPLAALCLLEVNVARAEAGGFLLKTYLSDKPAGKNPDPPAGKTASPDKLVEVSVAANGAASGIKGLDRLTPAERYAWNAWLGRFTSTLTFPKGGVRPGQRWTSQEEETSPSPVAELSWDRKYQYVKRESCTPGRVALPPDGCAVIFVHATLRQKSSRKNSTPSEYRLRGLATQGTAAGRNETVLYVAADTGILVRASEDVEQSMDVIIRLADGGNQVRYLITAKSRSRIDLLPDIPQDLR